jgi:hypothetical protein
LYLGKKKFLQQRSNLVGRFYLPSFEKSLIILKDLFGINKLGLENLLSSLGLESEFKKSISQNDKEHMFLTIQQKPYDFLNYALKDVQLTSKVIDRFVDQINLEILQNTFEIKPNDLVFTKHSIPITIGRLVANILDAYIKKVYFKNNHLYLLSLCKQSILSEYHKDYKRNVRLFESLRKITSLQVLKDLQVKDPILYDSFKVFLEDSTIFEYVPWQYCSIKFLLEKSRGSVNYITVANVTGGRTCNEQPNKIVFTFGMDLDIMGAYASILKMKISIIIGRPSFLGYTSNQFKRETLYTFLQKRKHNLTNGNWKIVVNGKFNKLSQDLIYSRLNTSQTMKNSKENFARNDLTTLKTTRPIALIKKEILDGVITQPILEVLEKVATSQEKSEINRLEVTSAIFYLDSNRAKSLEELCEAYMADQGQYAFNQLRGEASDNRCLTWYPIPLKPIMERLIALRKEKKKLKTLEAKASQTAFKLIGNTIYGILTSKYFPLNNVVTGDLITSSIRVACWMLAKAFNAYQSITDGVCSPVREVYFLKKKVGLTTLSSTRLMEASTKLYKGPFANENWSELFRKKEFYSPEKLNNEAQTHLKQFWEPYDLKFPFDLEAKSFILNGAYMGSAHYAYNAYNEDLNDYEIIYRIRGYQHQSKETNPFPNPIYQLLIELVQNPNQKSFFIPNRGFYRNMKFLKIPTWKSSLHNQMDKQLKDYSIYGNNYLPGDVIYTINKFRLSNKHFPNNTLEEHYKKNKRVFRKENSSKYEGLVDKEFLNNEQVPIVLFERYLDGLDTCEEGSFQLMQRQMELDELEKGLIKKESLRTRSRKSK